MKRLFTMLATLAFLMPALAEEPTPHELSGILTNTLKNLSPYELKLDGLTGSFYLRGDVLKGVTPGTRVWVRGLIKTELFQPVPPSPFFRQWHIFMDVTEVHEITKAFQRPQEKAAQNTASHGTSLTRRP